MIVAATRKLQIAALCCGVFPKHIEEQRGQFENMFAAWIDAAVAARNAKRPTYDQVSAEVTGYDVVEKGQYPPSLDDVDVLVVSGSPASCYEDEPWIKKLATYLRDVYENKPAVKIFGGCFGHQLLFQTLMADHGGRVVKNPKGWEIGVHQVDLTPEFSSHFPESLRDGKLSYQFLHQDVASIGGPLPPGWVQLGKSDLCDVQGLFLPGRVLTFQGHPEFDKVSNGLCTKLLEGYGMIPGSRVDEFLELVDREDSRTLAGEVAIEFFLSKP
ncbi:gmp synthase [Colletotrichum plurivorum]|uniref:Gmp synthase n=1 Tax=Colletotrichum plurivorum TaxID=2175906 RepID=A0A8H6K5S8_9PEZI|nr:gmp synthase [Colletotrichum plurivorum]